MADIQRVPPRAKRPETGPMQFDGDWPGVFIRGDRALYWAHVVRALLSGSANDPITLAAANGLAATLESCDAFTPPSPSP